MEVTRTFDLLERYRKHFMKDDAFVVKLNREWKKYSTQEYIDNSYRLSYGFLAMGLERGDKVASVTTNRPEWNFLDMALAMAGLVHVPLYTSLTPEEYENILSHSDSKLLFVSDRSLLKKIKPVAEKVGNLDGIYTFDDIEGERNWKEVVTLGINEEPSRKAELESIMSSISPSDCAALIYTSGTTGNSKGVMLSHENLVRNFLAAVEIFDLKPEHRYMSILPLCHVGGRMGNYQTQYSGSSIYYPESMGTIAVDMREVKAHGFDAVPRILEKIFDTIMAKGKKLTGMKKKIFFWAVRLGLRYKIPEESSAWYRFRLRLADKLIFSKWREAIGGNIELVGCGGAALQPRVERIFWAAGIKVINMYGLTETSPVITINRREKPELKLGSVGSTIAGVEVKIADDGEILCRGHNVMLGYYKNPELTAESFTEDGWFRTGDIGRLEEGKFLMVTDRKKEMFKLSSGKFIAPQMIENRFKESLFIEQIMVVGEHEKYASAIIAPDFSYAKEWCAANGINYPGNSELIGNARFLEVMNNEIEAINKSASDFEQVKRHRIVPDIWSPETGELSPTLKLKRSLVTGKYSHLINQIYTRQP